MFCFIVFDNDRHIFKNKMNEFIWRNDIRPYYYSIVALVTRYEKTSFENPVVWNHLAKSFRTCMLYLKQAQFQEASI